MSASRRLVLGVLLLIGVFLLAAGIIRLVGPPRQEGPAALPPSDQMLPAPDIEITMYQGGEFVGGRVVRLSRILAEGKPVVMNFFAGLCPPCRAEMPDLQRLYAQAQPPGFVLLGVDVGPYTGLGTREEGKSLLQTLGITYPAGTVFDQAIIDNYQILGMPTTVFILTDGRILRKHVGLLTFEQMQAFTDELVKASSTR